MLTMLRHGPKLMRQFVHSRTSSSIATGEMYFSHLYSTVRFPISQTFWVEVPGATILAPTGLAHTSDGVLIEESVHYDQVQLSLARQPDRVVRTNIEGLCLSLMSHWIGGSNYAHWLMDALTRLALWGKTDVKVLIEAGASPFLFESLITLGLKEPQILQLEPGAYAVEKLLVVRAQDRSGIPHGLFVKRLGAMYRTALGLEAAESKRRVYISRARSNRPIVNEDEILPHLKEHGFEIVHAEALSFEDQVRTFGTAEVIAGPHGAGIYNFIYAPEGCKVIEIINPLFWDHAARRIASATGAEHWHILAKNVDDEWRTRVDPEKFAKVLEYALIPPDSGQAKRFDLDY